MKAIKILIFIIMAIGMISCSDDKDEGIVVSTINYNLPDNCKWKDNIELEKIYLINNLDEMKIIVNCDDLSSLNIDFEKSTLLVVAGSENYVNVIHETILTEVKNNKYILQLIFKTNLSPTISPWMISLKIPKLTTTPNIELKKEYK